MPPPDCLEEFGDILSDDEDVRDTVDALGAQRLTTAALRLELAEKLQQIAASLDAEDSLLAQLATQRQALSDSIQAYQQCRSGNPGTGGGPVPLTKKKKKPKRKA